MVRMYSRGLEVFKAFLVKIEGGLGKVGGAAEVAPVVGVGAEGEDFSALGDEAEVGGDDREDAFFGEHGEEAGGDEVDAGESERLERSRREISCFVRNDGGLRNRNEGVLVVDAAAAELGLDVEEKGAGSFAGMDS